LRTQQKIESIHRGGLVCLALLVSSVVSAQTSDKRLQDLARGAQDRSVWPSIRRLAEASHDAERRGQAYLVLGYREYDAGEFESALPDLQAAAETGFLLADHARYYWADAAHAAGQPHRTAEILEGFTALHPTSTLRWAARELLAQALLEVNQPDRAISSLTAEPQTRRRPELAIRLAQAYWDAKNPEQAARIFQEVYYAFPLSAQANVAREALERLRVELADRFPETSEEIQTARVEIVAGRSRWQEALDEYTQLLASRPGSPLAPRWQLGRARCLIRLKQASQAVEMLAGSPALAPELDAQRLALLIDAFLQNSDPAAATQTLDLLRSLYPQSPFLASALSALGNVYVRQGEWSVAARYYQVLAERFPETAAGREAHWRVSWTYYLEGDLTRAHRGFEEHLRRYPDSEHVAGALYWLGRIAEQRGAGAEAHAVYACLRQRFVHSYYAQRAESRLPALAGGSQTRGAAAPPLDGVAEILRTISRREAPSVHLCETTPASAALEPFLLLKSLNLHELAVQYLRTAIGESSNSPELRLAMSRLRAEEKRPALALFEVRSIVPRWSEYEFSELSEEIWRLLYPQEYMSLVKRYARANGLDTSLVLGVIRQESAFNPRATSIANARGLMQILPQTVSRTRRGRARAARRLYDPAYNIRFGTLHLRGLLRNWNDIPEQALAAYHAGDFRVRDWLTKRSFQEPAEFLETIPIPSTRTYVEAVLRDAGIYRRLLTGEAKFRRCN